LWARYWWRWRHRFPRQTIGALKIRAIDLANGNLFGSNLFNISILGIDDLAYVDGPLRLKVSQTHALSGDLCDDHVGRGSDKLVLPADYTRVPDCRLGQPGDGRYVRLQFAGAVPAGALTPRLFMALLVRGGNGG
jgi:hypothetical protein